MCAHARARVYVCVCVYVCAAFSFFFFFLEGVRFISLFILFLINLCAREEKNPNYCSSEVNINWHRGGNGIW